MTHGRGPADAACALVWVALGGAAFGHWSPWWLLAVPPAIYTMIWLNVFIRFLPELIRHKLRAKETSAERS